MSQLQADQEPEGYLSLLLHECFHVYQRRFQEPPPGPFEELPELDADYSGGIGLESRVLAAALADGLLEGQRRELARQMVAVRLRRRAGRSQGLVRLEAREEYNEGTATYTQVRMMQLIMARGGLKARSAGKDAGYREFQGAEKRYLELLARILPGDGERLSFLHAQYQHGMALGLLLDHLRPGWKEELRGVGETQFAVLAREIPLTEEEWIDTAWGRGRAVRRRRDLRGAGAPHRTPESHDPGAAGARGTPLPHLSRRHPRQNELEAQGPSAPCPGGHDARPVPHFLPRGDSRRGGRGASIWEGGLEAFEKPGLSVVTGPTPIVFGSTCLEWTDPTPEDDLRDIDIEADSVEGEIYTGLRLSTEGLEVVVDRARVVLNEELVVVVPVASSGGR